jgi:predicted AlkP superfamily phosphohydrolase/phosphomutase/tetratricopeptide (TPR) repeat protein
MNDKKVVLIGWDAADWKVINPMLDAGLLPNLERMINGGVMGNLATLDPPYSPMLWTSIATGKRPYKHGVYGFQEPTEAAPGVRPVMSTTRTTRAIWNILNLKGKKSHVVGWWPSHPAEPVNGITISDFFQKSSGPMHGHWPVTPGAVHPKEMEDHFADLRVHPQQLSGAHLLPFVPNAANLGAQGKQRMGAIANETAQAATLHNCFTNILREQPWDFAAIYLATIDHYCHGFMKFHPPHRPHIPKAMYENFKDVVSAGYRYHDLMLGRILDLVGPETTVMLISDHGFQPDHLRPRDIPKEPAGPAYEHSSYGIFVATGPGIRKDQRIYGASLLDITPTLLHLYGLPIGEDMDGKVLAQILESDDTKIEVIPSWDALEGDDGRRPADAEEDEDAAARAMQQLVDLGYVEAPGDNTEANRERAQRECDFNLAKAYLDGRKVKKAVELLEGLYAKDNTVPRYALYLANCYQELNQLKKCRAVIDHLRNQELYDEPTLDVMEGALLLNEKRPLEAIKLFKRAEGKVNHFHSRLYLQMARGYNYLKRWKDAERSIKKDLAIDQEHAHAWSLLGQVYLSDNRHAEAAEALLTAVGLEYELPATHFRLGKALENLGEYAAAADAYQVVRIMLPDFGKARQALIELYTHHLAAPELAQPLIDQQQGELQGTITVVSGLPRSGTSLLMQMLEAGGMEIFTDKEREADDNNPKGYYEHSAVKNIAKNKRFLTGATDKAVKVIANLLPNIPPNFRYRIVFLERDLNEVLASQRKMLNRMGKRTKDDVYPTGLMNQFAQVLENVKEWASRHPNVEIIYIEHRDAIDNPFVTAMRINEFLSYELLPERMAGMVDAELYRERVAVV